MVIPNYFRDPEIKKDCRKTTSVLFAFECLSKVINISRFNFEHLSHGFDFADAKSYFFQSHKIDSYIIMLHVFP